MNISFPPSFNPSQRGYTQFSILPSHQRLYTFLQKKPQTSRSFPLNRSRLKVKDPDPTMMHLFATCVLYQEYTHPKLLKPYYRKNKKKHTLPKKSHPETGYTTDTLLPFHWKELPKEENRIIYVWVSGALSPLSPSELYRFMERENRPFAYTANLLFYHPSLKKRFLQASPKGPQPTFEKDLPIYLKKINEKVGWGAFAFREIHPGEHLGEYTGVISPEESGGTYSMFYALGTPQFPGRLDIDATFFGNETRFINHSETPNVDFIQTISSDGLFHTLFIAKRFIPKHFQFFIHYGNDYWKTTRPENLSTT